MFQHTGRHIKHSPTCCPKTEGVTSCLNYPPSMAWFQSKGKFDELTFIEFASNLIAQSLY